MALGCSVFEIEQWPARHVDEWRQFYILNPFGPWRDNYHAAIVADMVARVNGNNLPMSAYFYKDEETAIEERKKRDYETFKSITEVLRLQRDG